MGCRVVAGAGRFLVGLVLVIRGVGLCLVGGSVLVVMARVCLGWVGVARCGRVRVWFMPLTGLVVVPGGVAESRFWSLLLSGCW